MRFLAGLGAVVLLLIVAPLTAIGQQKTHFPNMKSRVLDAVFPADVATGPYFQKLILRFGDSDSEIIFLTYPGGRSEVIRYSLAQMTDAELSELISKSLAANPAADEHVIASTVKINVSKSSVELDKFEGLFHDLAKIRISPLLPTREPLDYYSEFEFWCDNWEESVHYTIVGPYKGDSQDKLVEWMIKFRADLTNVLKLQPPHWP